MEIQGLTNAQNTHYQHGVASQFDLSASDTTNGTVSGISSPVNDHSVGLRSDRNNNKRASSPALRLQPQNGSAARLHEKPNESNSGLSQQVLTSNIEFCNLNALKDKDYGDLELPPDFVKLKYGEDESEDGVLQMALPLFDGEEDGNTEPCEQPQSSIQPATSNNIGESFEGKSRKEIYVVFNIVKEEGERQTGQCGDDEMMESVQNTQEFFENQRSNKPNSGGRSSFKQNCDSSGGVDSGRRETENCVVTVGQEESFTSVACDDLDSMQQQLSGDFSDRHGKNVIHEEIGPPELPVSNNNSEFVGDLVNLASGGNGDTANDGPPETFSGTIMINNQSIIVTIENGVLTLAAPPDGYTYKEDGGVSIKEHLGMKENEDIVLLNYEGGGKTMGKVSENEHKTISDSEELTLADDCPLSDLGSSLDPSVKPEEEALCDTETSKDQTEDEQQPVGQVPPTSLTKKTGVVPYYCSQPGCGCAFDTRQKLKMHLVFHAEDQRPFKCTVEGCGWSFTTSYKLKRHLQSHYKLRPFVCEWENCGRRFTTVYNLKAHARAHEQEDSFPCEMCGERFRSTTRLANHQKTHFEPERPHKCEFPGCEKAFITFSALFSHNRTHFRETIQFTCTYPGCEKRYDKACRLKIHLRSHTGERPFVCDFESCESTFTSMSKLLRHKRKHDDDRRFTCPEKGCGKSFTRAEHLKGHSITHLGTKPFECPVEGCNAKFSARSSLYIHSKKHRQDGVCLRSRCPVAGCIKHFSSRSSLKSHMLKHHNLSPDVLNQLENTATLTPSCELTSAAQTATAPGSVGAELSSLDLSSLFSSVPSGATSTPVGPVTQSGPTSFSMDMALVGSGILTIDPASVGSALVGAKPMDPLILAAGGDIGAHVLDPSAGASVLQSATLQLDDVQTVNPEALGALTALTIQNTSATEHLQALSSSNALTAVSPSSSLNSSLTSSLASAIAPSLTSSLVPPFASTAVQELLSPQVKVDIGGSETPVGPLLSGVEGLTQAENNKSTSQFVFSSHSASFGGRKESELPSVTSCSFMESSGSARTDYRAIQLAKRKKQKSPAASTSGVVQRKNKGVKGSSNAAVLTSASTRFGEGAPSTTAGLTIRDPVTGAQYVQIQLLQDDPATDGDLAFQLSSQTSSSHSQLTVDLPVNILQETSAMTEEDNGSDNSQFTGSTINLQDLE